MKLSELNSLIEEAVIEVLQEQQPLQTSTQEILGKFPTLKKTLVNLMTSEYDEFVEDVKWIAPKPSTFEVVLKNGQSFFLKWLGKDFQAQIEGKKYMISSVDDFQQALDKLNNILKYSAPSLDQGEEEPQDFDTDTGGTSSTGGGDFPGSEEPVSEPESEPEGEEEIEFEEPGEEPT